MQSFALRRSHVEGAKPFVDTNATLHKPNAVPPMLLLATPQPTALQEQVYRGFAAASQERQLSAAVAAGAFVCLIVAVSVTLMRPHEDSLLAIDFPIRMHAQTRALR